MTKAVNKFFWQQFGDLITGGKPPAWSTRQDDRFHFGTFLVRYCSLTLCVLFRSGRGFFIIRLFWSVKRKCVIIFASGRSLGGALLAAPETSRDPLAWRASAPSAP